MLYEVLQCPEHKKQVVKLCLAQECFQKILCEVCIMNHELQHQSMQFTLDSFKSTPNFKGILNYFQNATKVIIENLEQQAQVQEAQQIASSNKMFQLIREDLMKLIQQLETLCIDAIQKRKQLFNDEMKLYKAQWYRIERTIQEVIPYFGGNNQGKIDQYKLLQDEIELYHQIEPKQKTLKQKLQMVNMDLQHSQAIQFYEDNLNKVITKIKSSISGVDKLFYIEQQYAQPKIPIEQHTLKLPYEVQRFKIHEDWVTAVCSLQEKYRIATCSSDKEIKIFDLQSAKVHQTLIGHTDSINALIYHWKSNLLISASSDRTIKLWDMEIFKNIGDLIGHQAAIKSLCYIQAEQNIIASCGADKKVIVWNLDQKVRDVICELSGHEDVVNCVVSFIFGDKAVLASSSKDNSIRIWDYIAQTCLIQLSSENNRVLLHQGQRLFSGGQSGQISIWDLDSQKCIHKLDGHQGAVNGLACVNNDDYFVSASWDQTVIVWDWKHEKIQATFSDPQHYCHGICYLNDGESFVTCSADTNIRLWQPQNQDKQMETLRTMERENYIQDNRRDIQRRDGICASKLCQIF